MKTELLSRLRIIGSDHIYPFEWLAESQKTKIYNLNEINLIRHPFMVTGIGNGNFLLLDETVYFKALVDSGLNYVPVQVCQPDEIDFERQRLGLIDYCYEDLLRISSKHPEQIILETKTDAKKVMDGYIAVEFEFANSPAIKVYLRHSSRTGCPQPLDCIFLSIIQKGRYLPSIDRNNASPESITKSKPLSGSITLPFFNLEDLNAAVETDKLFPVNILNIIARHRFLNIDYPMSVLTSEITPREKEVFLKELITIREQNRRTSFYEGHVYLLNR